VLRLARTLCNVKPLRRPKLPDEELGCFLAIESCCEVARSLSSQPYVIGRDYIIMAVAFGFSTGDFITCINLAKDIIRALKDSKGSSREYLEVIAEFRGLEVALVHAKAQYNDTFQMAQKSALGQAVDECQTNNYR
jgi:hypothetical protein